MRGTLEGHSGWVTSLATSLEKSVNFQAARTQQLTRCSPNMLLSGSRDKSLIIWNLTRDDQNYGYPKRSLHGHSHIVSDCVYLTTCRMHGKLAENNIRSFRRTGHMHFPPPGIRRSVFGSSPLVLQPVALLVTATTFSLCLSLPTTVKSSLVLEIGQSSCGTRSEIASSPLRKRATQNGYHAFGSAQILKLQ